MSVAATLIIGVGNEYRGDDSAGLVVARELSALALPRVDILEHSGEAGSLMDTWREANRVFLIDATRTGTGLGTIYRFNVDGASIPMQFRSTSTHDLGIAEAIELARLMGRLPKHLVVYGIEGQNFTVGAALSLPVERACREVVARVARELRDFADRTSVTSI